jgi:hypothetical protein
MEAVSSSETSVSITEDGHLETCLWLRAWSIVNLEYSRNIRQILVFNLLSVSERSTGPAPWSLVADLLLQSFTKECLSIVSAHTQLPSCRSFHSTSASIKDSWPYFLPLYENALAFHVCLKKVIPSLVLWKLYDFKFLLLIPNGNDTSLWTLRMSFLCMNSTLTYIQIFIIDFHHKF